MQDNEITAQLPRPGRLAVDIDMNHVQTILETRPPEARGSIEDVLEAAWNDACSEYTDTPRGRGESLQGFGRPYIGSEHTLLHERLSGFDKASGHAPVFPILQSSGTGKTRTVVELSTYAPGILLCIRSRSEEGYYVPQFASLPEPDEPIRRFLASQVPVIDTSDVPTDRTTFKRHWEEWHYHLQVVALLSATVQVFQERFHGALESSRTSALESTDEKWLAIIEQLRHDFTNNIAWGYRVPAPGATLDPNDALRHGESSDEFILAYSRQDGRPRLIERIAVLAEEIAARAEHLRPHHDVFRLSDDDLFHHHVMRCLDPILTVIKGIKDDLAVNGFPENPSRYLHIALDHFDTFRHLLTPVVRIMNALADSPVRVLLVDTTVELASVMGPLTVNASDQTSSGKLSYCEPYLIMSNDIQLYGEQHRDLYAQFLDGAKVLTHEQCRDFMRFMGRPLWTDMVNCRSYRSSVTIAGVCLNNVSYRTNVISSQREEVIFALAAARLPLQVLGFQSQ
jgi:hypothetical protein